MEFKPNKIVRESVANQVFAELRSNITNGTWKPGEKIPSENEIAEAFGVSRVSVRAAIQKLATLNMVETRAGGGTYVCQFKLSNVMKEISEVMVQNVSFENVAEFRALLEETSIRKVAAIGYRQKDLENLRLACEEMNLAVAKKDMEAFMKSDLHFHRTLCQLSGNEMLDYAYMMMNSIAYSYWQKQLDADTVIEKGKHIQNYWTEAAELHRKIYDALCRGDGEEAIQVLRSIID